MNNQKIKKKVYKETESRTTQFDSNTGEIYEETTTKDIEYYTDGEPPYVKIYFETILAFKGLPASMSTVLIAICKRMSWGDHDQIVYINKFSKTAIAKEVGISIKRLEQIIKDMTRVEIMKRIERGVYQVNPRVAARGRWKDIKKLITHFDFLENNITYDIETQTQEHPDSSTSMPKEFPYEEDSADSI